MPEPCHSWAQPCPETMQTLLEYAATAADNAVRFAPRIAITLLLAIFGWKAVNLLCNGINRTMTARKVDESLRPFITSLLSYVLKGALGVALIGYIGIPIASFVAVIGAAGLAIGMALTGTLQNFAGGVVILLLRPIRVGEFVEIAGFLGKVHEIHIFHTTLLSPDNRTIFIPNSQISNAAITNFARQDTRRFDLMFGIGYGDDLEAAKHILRNLVDRDTRVLRDPEPLVAVENLGENSVDLLVRAWTPAEDFLTVQQDLREAAKKAFDADGISIPFPQRDVHLIPAPSAG